MIKRKQYDIKIYKQRSEEHEIIHNIPKNYKGLILCKECNATYYKKSWHHNLRGYNAGSDASVRFVLCPACKIAKNKQFEGEIVISNVPEQTRENLKNLILAYCHRAYRDDNQHRLISLKELKNSLIATTTENQLAIRLAKKIKDTFKKVEIKKTYSPSPSDVVYIKIEFKQ